MTIERAAELLAEGYHTEEIARRIGLSAETVKADTKRVIGRFQADSRTHAVAIALRDGLNTIPPIYQRAGLMMGARGWRLYRYVLLPASLPALAGSLRQGFSFAWRSLMGAELILFADEALYESKRAGRDRVTRSRRAPSTSPRKQT